MYICPHVCHVQLFGMSNKESNIQSQIIDVHKPQEEIEK